MTEGTVETSGVVSASIEQDKLFGNAVSLAGLNEISVEVALARSTGFVPNTTELLENRNAELRFDPLPDLETASVSLLVGASASVGPNVEAISLDVGFEPEVSAEGEVAISEDGEKAEAFEEALWSGEFPAPGAADTSLPVAPPELVHAVNAGGGA